MTNDQKDQLDDLRRAIRELPENTIFIVGNEHPDYPGMYGHTEQTVRIAAISPKDLKLLEAELTRVEGELKDYFERSWAKADENAHLTSRVAELEAMIEDVQSIRFYFNGCEIYQDGDFPDDESWCTVKPEGVYTGSSSLLEAWQNYLKDDYAALKLREAGEEK